MSKSAPAENTDKIVKSDAARRAELTPEQYPALRQHGNGVALRFKPEDG